MSMSEVASCLSSPSTALPGGRGQMPTPRPGPGMFRGPLSHCCSPRPGLAVRQSPPGQHALGGPPPHPRQRRLSPGEGPQEGALSPCRVTALWVMRESSACLFPEPPRVQSVTRDGALVQKVVSQPTCPSEGVAES